MNHDSLKIETPEPEHHPAKFPMLAGLIGGSAILLLFVFALFSFFRQEKLEDRLVAQEERLRTSAQQEVQSVLEDARRATGLSLKWSIQTAVASEDVDMIEERLQEFAGLPHVRSAALMFHDKNWIISSPTSDPSMKQGSQIGETKPIAVSEPTYVDPAGEVAHLYIPIRQEGETVATLMLTYPSGRKLLPDIYRDTTETQS